MLSLSFLVVIDELDDEWLCVFGIGEIELAWDGCAGPALEVTVGVVASLAKAKTAVVGRDPARNMLEMMIPSSTVRLRKKSVASDGISSMIWQSSAPPCATVGISRAMDVNLGWKEASRGASADCTAAAWGTC